MLYLPNDTPFVDLTGVALSIVVAIGGRKMGDHGDVREDSVSESFGEYG